MLSKGRPKRSIATIANISSPDALLVACAEVSHRACANKDGRGSDIASGASSAGALQGGGGGVPAHRDGSGGQRRHADAGVGGEHAPGGCSGECGRSPVGAGPCGSWRHQVQDAGGNELKQLCDHRSPRPFVSSCLCKAEAENRDQNKALQSVHMSHALLVKRCNRHPTQCG